MIRAVVFGNSGAGKSTLAGALADRHVVAHLDLDPLAYEPDRPGVRRPLDESLGLVREFTAENAEWIIEGCYASLLEPAIAAATHVIFVNPGIEACAENCRGRPWEPHKYSTREAQDANLEMLLDWARAYETRDDEFSLSSHRQLFDGFTGEGIELMSNEEAAALRLE